MVIILFFTAGPIVLLTSVTITKEKTTDGYETTRSYVSLDDKIKNIPSTSYDVSRLNPNWRLAGSFVERNKSMPVPVNGKVKIGRWATHWQTGERMADFVKGSTFPVVETKNIRQGKSSKAYLLPNIAPF